MKPYSTATAAITLMLLSTPGAFSFPEPKLRGAVYLESDVKETSSTYAVKISEDDMDVLVEAFCGAAVVTQSIKAIIMTQSIKASVIGRTTLMFTG